MFNFFKLFRVHGLVRNANGTFMRITFIKEDGTKRSLVGRTGVKWQGKPSEMFRSLYHVNFYGVREEGFRTIPIPKITHIATCGKVEVL